MDITRINREIAEISQGKTTFAFFISRRNVIPDEWMRALGQKLRDRGHAAFGFLTGDTINCMNLQGMEKIYEVSAKDVQKLSSINCFIVTDMENYVHFPAQSRVLGIIHSCAGILDPLEYLQGSAFLGVFDGYIVGFPFHKRKQEIIRLYEDWTPPARQWRPGGDYYLMGYGYPKLSMIREKIKALRDHGQKQDAICYAPTDINYGEYYGGKRVQSHGKRIIRSLLSLFPDHKVIFRPTPLNINEPLIQEIAAYFSCNPRFIFDTNTSYLQTMAMSQIIISDLAHIATTFIAATGKPAIFFRPWQKNERLEGLFPWTTNSYTKLIKIIKSLLSFGDIKDIFPDYMTALGFLPVENALEKLADDLPDFVNKKAHEDWVIIKRDFPSSGASPAQVILAVMRDWESQRLSLARFFAFYFDSPLLSVFSLHLFGEYSPDLQIDNSTAKRAGLDPICDGARYKDISDKTLAELYFNALKKLEQYRNVSPPEKLFYLELARGAAGGASIADILASASRDGR